MKKTHLLCVFHLILLTLTFSWSPVQGQTRLYEECETYEGVELIKSFQSYTMEDIHNAFLQYLEDNGLPDHQDSIHHGLPVKAHIIRHSNGTGGLTVAELDQILLDVNDFYAPMNISFSLCGSIHYIDEDTVYNYQLNKWLLAAQANFDDVINIYFYPNLEPGTCGAAAFPSSGAGLGSVHIRNDCPASTTAHELGHYLGLWHTHHLLNGNTEFVNGSNCTEAGDGLCDTPADHSLLINYVNPATCLYSSNLIDPNGDPYDSDPRNMMSYSQKHCRDTFSAEQFAKMRFVIDNYRTYLIDAPTAPVADFDFFALCSGEVSFYDLSENCPDDWLWDFGDGMTSTEANPTHQYAASGNYEVTLSIHNAAFPTNVTHTETVIVDIYPSPPIVLTGGACFGNEANLSTSEPGNAYHWFRNGTKIIGAEDTTYTAYQSGAYHVEIAKTNCVLRSQSDTADLNVQEFFFGDLNIQGTPLESSQIRSVYVDESNNKWIGTFLNGLYRFSPGDTFTLVSNPAIIENTVNEIIMDSQGNLWLGVGIFTKVLVKYDVTNNTWDSYPTINSGRDVRIRDIAIDDSDKVWLATEDGLMSFDGTTWQIFDPQAAGMTTNLLFSVAIDWQGNIWVGNGDGLQAGRFDGTNWTFFEQSNNLHEVRDIAVDLNGHLWFAGYNGISRYDGINWDFWRTSVNGSTITLGESFAIDQANQVWLASSYTSQGGLFWYDGQNWWHINTENSLLPHDRIWSVDTDANGNRWIGTFSGLEFFQPGVQPPDRKNVCDNSTSLLSALSGNFTYQWIKNQQGITGATSSTYLTSELGTYHVSLDDCPDMTSPVTLTDFISGGTVSIAEGQTEFSYCEEINARINILHTNEDLTFQWQKMEYGTFEDMAGANLPFYTASNTGRYRAEISDSCGNTLLTDEVVVSRLGAELAVAEGSEYCVGTTLQGGNNFASYSWSTGDTTASIIPQTAGPYSLTACYFPYLLLDQHLKDPTANSNSHEVDSAWQSFQAGQSQLLAKISQKLEQNNSADTTIELVLKIYEGEGTSGNLIYQDTYSVTNTTGWKDFTINSNSVSLTQGQKYTFKIVTANSQSLQVPIIHSQQGYANGYCSINNFNDFIFETYTKEECCATVHFNAVACGTCDYVDVEYSNTENLPPFTSTTNSIIAGNLDGSGDVKVLNGQNVSFLVQTSAGLFSGFQVELGGTFEIMITECGN